ncbi:MAG: PfkB family carbohydrate kinase [Pseudomonadota bacterium]
MNAPFSTHEPSRIVVVGAAHMDRTANLLHPAQPGQSIPGTTAERPGGAALNVASNLAALGHRPELYSIVSHDAAAQTLKAALQNRHVSFQAQFNSALPTASYFSVVNPDGTLAIAVADMAIYDAFEATPLKATLEQLSKNDWLILDANLPSSELVKLASYSKAKTVGLTVSAAKSQRLHTLLANMDILLTNAAEAEVLAGGEASAQESSDPVQSLARLGVPIVVMTNSDKPVVAIDHGQIHEFEVPAFVKTQADGDVIGAGDALATGVIDSLIRGRTLENGVVRGIRMAHQVLRVAGPWSDQLGIDIQAN